MTVTEIVGWLILISYLAVWTAGATNKVVIFEDVGDFAWTIGIVMAPIAIWIPNAFIGDGEIGAAIPYLMGVAAIVCSLKTYINSVKSNGWALGIIVGTFRVFSALILLVFSLGLLSKYIGDDRVRGVGPMLILILVTTLFFWFIKAMFNGEEVRDKRALN